MCNVLVMPGGANGCPTILRIPKTNVHPCGKFGLKRSVVALRVKVRNIPIAVPRRICGGLTTKTLGKCGTVGGGGHSARCCGQICLNYIQTISFLCSLPRFSKGAINIANKDRKKTLSVIATKLSPHVGFLTTFCPTLYSCTNCLRGHTKN